jgi:hypothetical protein
MVRRLTSRHTLLRTPPFTTLPGALVGSLLVAAALTGCSAGTLPGGGSNGGGTSGSGSSTNPPAASGGSGRPFTLPPACLSAAQVAGTLGVDAYGPTKTGDSKSLVCEYLTATKDGPIIDIEPSGGIAPSAWLAKLTSTPPQGATVTPTTGLGDAAALLKFPNGNSIIVLTGKYSIDIAGLDASPSNLEQLAKEVLAG